VRVEGRVERVAAEEAEAYFRTRPLASRIAAWASPQSRPLASRDELEQRVAAEAARHGDDPPLPPHWGGFRLVPAAFEFWQHGDDRLHDRVRYDRGGDGWSRTRLAP
jgi:pyridoxamine 5'-phosphate oxidase